MSAGFDAHERDPLASMRVTTGGYARVVAHLKDAAARHGAIALVTEGGYELPALGACLDASIDVLRAAHKTGTLIVSGDSPAETVSAPDLRAAVSTARAERALERVRAAQSSYWRGI